MTAASNSESRKRRTVAADPVEIVAQVFSPQPCANESCSWCLATKSRAADVVAALQAAGLLTPP